MTHIGRTTASQLRELEVFDFKKAMFVTNYRYENYQSTGISPINIQYTCTISKAQTKLHEVKNILSS